MFSRFRLLCCSRRTVLNGLEGPDKSVFVTLVRGRKRRWAPINASKLFVIPDKTKRALPPDELAEIRQRYNIYRTQVRAIRHHILESYKAAILEKTDFTHVVEEAREAAILVQANADWNEHTRKLREVRQEGREREIEERRLDVLMRVEQQKEEQLVEANTHVRTEKEKVKSFVTAENLDDEIERALNSRINYNFVIDTAGNRYIEMPDGNLQAAKEQTEAKGLEH